MGYPGTWMTTSGSMIYRVVPKCACSTIGQIMFYADQGHFYDGDIHDADHGLHKWGLEHSRDAIEAAVTGGETFTFTCVRNPYTRILSAFFDKICGIQRNGNRYRGNLVPMLVQQYGVQVEGEFDQIDSFRRFLLFARDTIRYRKPMDPDIHWSAVSGHVSTLVTSGARYDHIFFTEAFNEGMQVVLNACETTHPVTLSEIPRFNESEGHGPRREHPVEAYFDDLAMHLMYEIYKKDFELFQYDFENPANKYPKGPVDLDEVHFKLGPRAAA